MHGVGKRLLAVGCCLNALAASQAFAQTATTPVAQDEAGLTDIIVTAQKRAESVQDVPITITAFDQTALETRRIDGFEQIAAFTPALSVAPSSADANGLRFTLRGIGVADPQIGVESKVALYVDGLYLGKTTGLAFDSPDLARVEVLKGPQGTLYGRNAVAGAINLISSRPEGGRFFGKAFAEYGNYDAIRGGFALNLPGGENGGFRISALYNRRDGWIDNKGPGRDFGGYERWGVRFAAGGQLAPTLRVDAAFDYNEAMNEPVFYHPIAGTNAPTALFAGAVTPVTGRVDTATTSFEVGRGKATNLGGVVTAEWEWADRQTLKLVTGYRTSNVNRFSTLVPTYNPAIGNAIYNADLDRNPANGVFSLRSAFLAAPALLGIVGTQVRPDYLARVAGFVPGSFYQSSPGGATTLEDHEQFSADLTASGKASDLLDYTVGAYYFHEDTGSGRPTNRADDVSNIIPLLSALGTLGNGLGRLGALQDPTLPPAARAALFGQAQGFANDLTNFYRNVRFSAGNQLRIKTDAYALYGSLTWHLGDRLRLITGARYSIDTKDGRQQSYSPIFQDQLNLLGEPILPNLAKRTFRSFDPTIIVQFDLNKDAMLYASRVESYRSGGFNQVSQGLRLPGTTYASDFIYDKEEITAYEVGLKSDLFDRRIRLNLAGFYYLLDNEQIPQSLSATDSVARVIANADTKIWGGEAEVTIAPVRDVRLGAAYAYTDGDAKPVVVGNLVVPRPTLLGAPKHSLALSADYDQNGGRDTGLFAHVGYNYKSKTVLVFIPYAETTDQNLVDARIGYRFGIGGARAKVSVWGQNLLDDKYIVDKIGFGALAYDVVQYGTPRTYGISLGVDF